MCSMVLIKLFKIHLNPSFHSFEIFSDTSLQAFFSPLSPLSGASIKHGHIHISIKHAPIYMYTLSHSNFLSVSVSHCLCLCVCVSLPHFLLSFLQFAPLAQKVISIPWKKIVIILYFHREFLHYLVGNKLMF